MITQELVKTLFDYKNGNLYWKESSQGRRLNKLAGTLRNSYRQVMINGKLYYVHRIIFLWNHGYLPKVVDHIDGNPTNNSIENLRGVTHIENLWNAKLSKKNTSGAKGVSYIKAVNRYQATISINGKNKNLGHFDTLEEAKNAVMTARTKLHKEFARHE